MSQRATCGPMFCRLDITELGKQKTSSSVIVSSKGHLLMVNAVDTYPEDLLLLVCAVLFKDVFL